MPSRGQSSPGEPSTRAALADAEGPRARLADAEGPPGRADSANPSRPVLPPPPIPPMPRARWLRRYGIPGLLVLAVVLVASVGLLQGQPSVLELHTKPSGAMVTVDGHPVDEVTPLRITLPARPHRIAVSAVGYQSFEFTTQAEAGRRSLRKLVELEPLERPALVAIRVEVRPVDADIQIDRDLYIGRRFVEVSDLDPHVAHEIVIEASGYQTVEHRVAPGELKRLYRYILERDEVTSRKIAERRREDQDIAPIVRTSFGQRAKSPVKTNSAARPRRRSKAPSKVTFSEASTLKADDQAFGVGPTR